jgi:hypothetical protein
MGMSDTLIRGRLIHKYHYCGRCGVRYPLSRMVWQSSGKGKVLLCLATCYDTMTDIQRDAEITRKVQIAGNGQELLPDVKLTDGATVDIDDISFVP